MSLRAIYVDFNSYFASVEQQLRPELRGKPIGVLPVLAETTCCIAASVEAKRFGVKTGTSVRDARKLCRDIILVEARPAVYVEMHHKLVAAVESCLHVEQVRSIDEMWCRLRGSDAQRDKAIWLAQEIKHAIYKAGGSEMRCSIGIGPNRFLAKTASNMQKPNGLVVIEQSELPQRLFGLKLRDLNGIGYSMEARLEESGIHTVEKLCAASAWQLRKAWRGVMGERFHAMLHGHDVPEIETERRSIGHSHVLPPQLRNKNDAYAVLHRLLQKAAMRLRSLQCIAGQLCVHIKLMDRRHNTSRWYQDAVLDPTSDTRALLSAFDHAWRNYPEQAEPLGWIPLKVGVMLVQIEDAANETYALFGQSEGEEAHQLNVALDALNLHFGKNTLYFGGASSALTAAPMRIAFNHVPDIKVEADE
jgi:DNA polymerase IV